MSNLEKFRIEERVKLALLRHRGEVTEVARELNMDLAYVRKIYYKIKKREERDVGVLIAHNLMTHIMSGYEGRVAHLMDMLRSLNSEQRPKVSACCGDQVEQDPTDPKKFICLRCGLVCKVKTLTQVQIYKLRQDILVQLRDEDTQLIQFAEKMGYTQKQEPPQVNYNDNRQQLVFAPGFKGQQESPVELGNLTPLEIENLRKGLESGEPLQNLIPGSSGQEGSAESGKESPPHQPT